MVRVDDAGDVTKCWLDREELSEFEAAAARADWEREIAVMLMGRCGFRADEVTYPGDAELRWSDDGECWFAEVRGKNTSGGEPKLRDAWIPETTQTNITRFSRERRRETRVVGADQSVEHPAVGERDRRGSRSGRRTTRTLA